MKKIIILLTSLLFIFTTIFPTIIGDENYIQYNNPLALSNCNQKHSTPTLHGKILLSPQINGTYIFPGNESDSVIFNWGDGNESEGFYYPLYDGFMQKYQWEHEGEYMVKAKTINSLGINSEWSDELQVTVKEGVKDIEYQDGLGYTVIFHNHYSYDFNNLTWSIEFDKAYRKNFGVILSGRYANGSIENLPPLGTIVFKSKGLFGLGYFGKSIRYDYETIFYIRRLAITWDKVIIIGPFVFDVNDD